MQVSGLKTLQLQAGDPECLQQVQDLQCLQESQLHTGLQLQICIEVLLHSNLNQVSSLDPVVDFALSVNLL